MSALPLPPNALLNSPRVFARETQGIPYDLTLADY
jgi:hypothetical protein